jgi:hypothetical protein
METKERFAVWTTPASVVYAKAAKAGWDKESDIGPSDYIDIATCDKRQEYPTFDQAVAYCRNYIKSGSSWWGVADVYREKFDAEHSQWLRDYRWVVSDAGVEDEEPIEDGF